ncbi:MAG: hypothetical protein ACI9XJ_001897, partial [Marivirga sp.]
MKATDAYYENKDAPLQACLLSLREIILNTSPHFTETIKWGMPCFSYKKQICCFLNIDKKMQHPYILFSSGRLLNHPQLAFEGRKKMASLSIDPSK